MSKISKGNQAITILSLCPLRSKPSDEAEMVSQLLFGETVTIIEAYKENWVKVCCHHDDYLAWMDPKQLTLYNPVDDPNKAINLDITTPVFADDMSTYITMGATLPNFDGITSTINETKFRFSGQALPTSELSLDPGRCLKLAKKLLNSPYLWGGRSPFGIDCSGLTQIVMSCCGIRLPRDSRDQAFIGETVDFMSMSKAGDLAFFSKETEKISHVGIIVEDQQILHASGKVRIDALDQYGIYKKEIGQYTHRLKTIQRHFPNPN